jgi:hypothetical protein
MEIKIKFKNKAKPSQCCNTCHYYHMYPDNGGICNNLISDNVGLLYHDIGNECFDYKKKEIKRLTEEELEELNKK